MIRERSVESHLRSQVKAAGGLCIKLNPAGNVGLPDRLMLLPGGVMVFVECKKPRGAKIGRLQDWWRDRLIGLGFYHAYAYTRGDVDELIKEFSV